MSAPLFLRVAKAAQLADVDVRTLRKGIDDGTIPHVRIGNTIRIPAAPFFALCGITEPADIAAAIGAHPDNEEAATVAHGDRLTSLSTNQEARLTQESTRDHDHAA